MNFFVISLRKNFFMLLFLMFTISLIFFSSTNLIAAKEGLVLWATNVVPSLFPFFIATELLCKTNFIKIIGKFLNKFMRPIFNVPGESATALLLGTISGYPIGAKVVCNLKNQKIISKAEAERLIAYTNNSGPLFILGSVGISLFGNKKIGIILLISHIISCIIVGCLFKFWKKNEVKFDYSCFNKDENKLIKISNLGEIIGDSIKNAITTILSIGGFIVLFSVIISILNSYGIINILTNTLSYWGISNEITSALITGLIELTNGVNLSSSFYNSNPLTSILLTSFLLGFGGLSILLQVYSIITKEKISIKPYFYGKLLQGIISVFITYFLIYNKGLVI